METTSKIYRVQSNPAWGGVTIFHSFVLFQIRLVVHSCQQSHVRASSAMQDWRSGMRVGGWADGAQGCGLRSFSQLPR